MMHNPILRKLGFDRDDRVVIVHADDVGMCHATVPAFFDLAARGLVSAGSVMVPCPWFREAAAEARRNPQADLGVHLTLTSEWENYRWGPVVPCDPRSGMTDGAGCFFRAPALMDDPGHGAVLQEMRTQVERALDAGIDVTHIDCHMFAMLAHGLAQDYVSLGFEFGLPVLMTRQPAWVDVLTSKAIDDWEEQGVPVFDHLREMPLNCSSDTVLDSTKRIFEELPPGFTYLLMHPALDTPELRAICTDWRQRVADYEVFGNSELCQYVRAAGIHVIGWRPIQQLMKGESWRTQKPQNADS